jgi:hypothetical protein
LSRATTGASDHDLDLVAFLETERRNHGFGQADGKGYCPIWRLAWRNPL